MCEMPIMMVTIMKRVLTSVPTVLWRASIPSQTGVLQCSGVLGSEVSLTWKLCDSRGVGQECEAPRWPPRVHAPSVPLLGR